MIGSMTTRRFLFSLLVVATIVAAFLIKSLLTPKTIYEPSKPPFVTIFLIDGLSPVALQNALDSKKLPEISRIIREGVYIPNGIAAFPSMTGYGFYPLITGHLATQSGTLGLRWFDRRRQRGNFRSYVGRTSALMNGDLRKTELTLFERFPRRHHFSINSYMNRGVDRDEKVGWSFMTAKYQHDWWLVRWLAAIPFLGSRIAPSWEGAEDNVIKLAIADLKNSPQVQWITLTSLDGFHHINGDKPRYDEILLYLDSVIGRYRAASRELGSEGDRIYLLLSDHGMVDVRHNLDLWKTLSALGIPTVMDKALRIWERSLEAPIDTLSEQSAVVAVNGNTMAYIYLRNPALSGDEQWRSPPSRELLNRYPVREHKAVDLIDALRRVTGVALVAVRGTSQSVSKEFGSQFASSSTESKTDSVELYTASGKALIQYGDRGVAYHLFGERDPFNYRHDDALKPLLDGEFHSADEWMNATYKTEFPYAPVRLAELFAQESCGDIILTAEASFDFGHDYEFVVKNYHGGHGGLRADQIRVPYILSGPGIKRGLVIDTARAEDIGATLLTRLNLVKNGEIMDGTVLDEIFLARPADRRSDRQKKN